MDLHGMAMNDYLNGEPEAAVLMHRDNGLTHPPIFAARWFYEDGFPTPDSKALTLCKGKVLHVGSSSESHSLFLENEGIEVGPWFNWLAMAPEALEKHARDFGFQLEVEHAELGRSLCTLRFVA